MECHLDDLGYCFVKKCIETVEKRGLDDQGLYRVGGVHSRVTRLLKICLDSKNYNRATGEVNMPDFSDPVEWETKTITSALKKYLRNLSEPLMTYNLHPAITEAAKIDNSEARKNRIKNLIQQLPVRNFTLLKILVEHLRNVANHSQKNLMTVSNLGICFGPTLMRGPEQNSSSITDIKYSNVVANTLIENYTSIFNDQIFMGCQPDLMTPPLSSTLRHTTPTSFHSNSSQNLEDQFGLPLVNQQHQQLQHHQHQHQQQHQQQHQLPHQYQNQIQHQQAYKTSINQIGAFFHNNLANPIKLPQRSNKVITLYPCVADTESELTFGPNEIVTDVRYSNEKGWLIGTLQSNGLRGLLPENYVRFI